MALLEKDRQTELLKWFYAHTYGCNQEDVTVSWLSDNYANIDVVNQITDNNEDYVELDGDLVVGNISDGWTLDMLLYLFQANTMNKAELVLYAAKQIYHKHYEKGL